MERYDGKTKKDDYIKYGLITAVVIMILAIIFTANHLVRKHYHKEPDYKVVVVSEEALDEDRIEALESMIAGLSETSTVTAFPWSQWMHCGSRMRQVPD